ncbi:hypothetical protein SETIT_4G149700v2 [Setaria italica]|uniref:CCHC-type domain-containing protein n=1 Tax=Setaria italica TaxID=4555 RepID=A0A368QUE8_SETIT|nr:hypothetical protein SETIT_4G149700v2 [Setaria italica]
MREHLMAVNPTLWDVVNVGITFPFKDATLTQYQFLCTEEFDKVDGFQSAKEVWDTLFINHQGTKRVRKGRIRALESELNRFIIKEDETPQEMEKRGFKKFTLVDVIGRIEEHLITVAESKLSQEMSKIHEKIEKNNGVALKESQKSKEKEASSSSKATTKKIDDDSDSESMDEEEMALFMRRIRRVMKRGGFFEKNKDKEKNKRKSKRSCFGCGKEGHFIANCPDVKIMRNDISKHDKNKYKKKIGEAHFGQEWDSNEESSDSNEEVGVATMAFEAQSPNSLYLMISPMMKKALPTLASWLEGQR